MPAYCVGHFTDCRAYGRLRCKNPPLRPALFVQFWLAFGIGHLLDDIVLPHFSCFAPVECSQAVGVGLPVLDVIRDQFVPDCSEDIQAGNCQADPSLVANLGDPPLLDAGIDLRNHLPGGNMQTRVLVYDQIKQHDRPDEWCLIFQRVRYVYENGEAEEGFRFIWMRPNGTLQAARGQARIPSLSTALWFIQQAEARGWERPEYGEDASGLEMAGLSEEMQNTCTAVYNRFLERHGIKRFPLKVSLMEGAPLPGAPPTISRGGRLWRRRKGLYVEQKRHPVPRPRLEAEA